MKREILIYHVEDQRAIEMEFFMRGAVAMSSENVDWSFSTATDSISIFCADPLFKSKLEATFGRPDKVEAYTGHLA